MSNFKTYKLKNNKQTEILNFSTSNFFFILLLSFLSGFNENIITAKEVTQNAKFIKIDNNGKINKVDLVYFNDSRYIDIEKIPNNIINKAKYNSDNHTITNSDFRLQFLPGSFFYTLDNIEETKVVQLYLPIIVKSNSNSKIQSKVKNKLYIPFVSFMKSLDSAGLYDVRYEIVNGEDIIRVKSKKTEIDFTVKFPKLNFVDDEIIDDANAAKATSNQEMLSVSEDFWDKERIESYNKLAQNLEDDLTDNELAEVIGDIANKVFKSIQLIDKQKPADNNTNINNNTSVIGTGSGSGSGNSKLLSIMPRYKGVIKQRKSYTDPFPNLKLENDNIKVKVYNPDKEKPEMEKTSLSQAKTKKTKIKQKEVDSDKIETQDSKNQVDKKQNIEKNLKIESNTDNKGYYLPSNLKRPGIDF